jgi:hypothetical protein
MSVWSEEHRHDRMRDAYAQAVRLCPDRAHEMWYSFGGCAVRVRIVGNRLAERVALPFAHLRCEKSDSAEPRLTIDLWDELETNVPACIDLQPVAGSSSFSVSRDGRFATSVLQHSITDFDRREEHILGVALGADRLSLYECGRPLHVPLSLWYSDHDILLVHAGLVSHNGNGILLTGSSGAGKTTSALSCLAAGFRYLADDLAGLELLGDGAAWGHSIYGSALVDQEILRRLPGLSQHAIPGTHGFEEKRLVLISRVNPSRLMGKTIVRAIGLVRVADSDQTRVRAATKGESLLSMVRSALQSGVLTPGKRGFELLGYLSDNVPSFWLELGRDVEDIASCIRELLASTGGLREGRAQ